MNVSEEIAKRFLALVRTDTANSELPPDDYKRESLLTESITKRVRLALQDAVAQEREACAKIADRKILSRRGKTGVDDATRNSEARVIAKAIRARSEPEGASGKGKDTEVMR